MNKINLAAAIRRARKLRDSAKASTATLRVAARLGSRPAAVGSKTHNAEGQLRLWTSKVAALEAEYKRRFGS